MCVEISCGNQCRAKTCMWRIWSESWANGCIAHSLALRVGSNLILCWILAVAVAGLQLLAECNTTECSAKPKAERMAGRHVHTHTRCSSLVEMLPQTDGHQMGMVSISRMAKSPKSPNARAQLSAACSWPLLALPIRVCAFCSSDYKNARVLAHVAFQTHRAVIRAHIGRSGPLQPFGLTLSSRAPYAATSPPSPFRIHLLLDSYHQHAPQIRPRVALRQSALLAAQ